MRKPLTVVKVGGSLLASGRLRAVLASLAATRSVPLVVVPGGGVFADAVRTAQGALELDDALAHRLGLDAMGHMAQIFAALDPAYVVAPGIAACQTALEAGRLPVWDPLVLRDGHPDIPESWSVTSDSLALWLGAELGADRVVLVKSADPPPGADPLQLVAAGLVDDAFPAFAARFSGVISIHGPNAGNDLARSLRGPGARAA